MRVIVRFLEYLGVFWGEWRDGIRRAMGWVEEHPVEVATLLELARALRRGEAHHLGAKVLGTCLERDVVRVQLDDGRVVEVPLECVHPVVDEGGLS